MLSVHEGQTMPKRRNTTPRHRRNPIAHYNTIHDEVPMDGTAEAIKKEFARRLEAARVAKGWNQSELARHASDYLPNPVEGQKQGHRIGRDQISHYTRGVSLPRPETLRALARALSVEPRDLMPSGVPSTSTPKRFNMSDIGDGRCTIIVNAVVPFKTALEIAALVNKEDEQ